MACGEGARKEDRAAIVAALESSHHVDHLIHLRTQHIGPDEILVAAKVEYDSHLTFDEVSEAINVTEANVRKVVPAARMIYIEPDVLRRSKSTSSAKFMSSVRSSSTFLTACITVVWSRPPNLRPISGKDRRVSCLERYIATCRGRAKVRTRFGPIRSERRML